VIGFFVSLFLSASAQRHKGCSAACDRFFCFTFFIRLRAHQGARRGRELFFSIAAKTFFERQANFFLHIGPRQARKFLHFISFIHSALVKMPAAGAICFFSITGKIFFERQTNSLSHTGPPQARIFFLARGRRESFCTLNALNISAKTFFMFNNRQKSLSQAIYFLSKRKKPAAGFFRASANFFL